MSYENYWHISEDGQVSVANRNPTISGTNTVTEQNFRMLDNELEEVLGLGILYFDRKSLVWDKNHFTAQTGDEKFGTIAGYISDGDGVRPKSVEYSFSKKDNKYKITYEYGSDSNTPSWFPRLIIFNVTSPRPMPPPYSKLTHSITLTNSIQKIILGSADVGLRG
jgi:hypothetical protein